MNMSQRPIVVLGGSGHYGRHIVRRLLEEEVPVKVLTRNLAKARRTLGDGPEILGGDITERDSVMEVLREARALVICVSAFNWKSIRHLVLIERDAVLSVLEEAQKAGISRVVYMSVYDIREDLLDSLHLHRFLPMARIKRETERALAESDFNWTILGLPPSMEIFFAMIRGNTMWVPGGGPPALLTVSPVDVGEIAAQSVLRGDLAGKRLRLTGSEALSFPEAAKRIAAVTGRRITFSKMPLLPLQIAAVLTRPFNPFLGYVLEAIELMNRFPQDFARAVPEDHRLLKATFAYTPTTLEMEARRRMAG